MSTPELARCGTRVYAYTQSELEQALRAHRPGEEILLDGPGPYHIEHGIPQLKARGAAEVTITGGVLEAFGGHGVQVRAQGDAFVTLHGAGRVIAGGFSRVIAYGGVVEATGQAQVGARGAVQVRARGQARIDAGRDAVVNASDQTQVYAWGVARVRAAGECSVDARGLAEVEGYDKARISVASPYVRAVPWTRRVEVLGPYPGQHEGPAPPIDSYEEWVRHHGAPPTEDPDVFILFKTVGDGYYSLGNRYNVLRPGTMPRDVNPSLWRHRPPLRELFPPQGINRALAPDLYQGMFFAASPGQCLFFRTSGTHMMACPVRLSDLVYASGSPLWPEAGACGGCAPCWEVDLAGQPVAASATLIEQNNVREPNT